MSYTHPLFSEGYPRWKIVEMKSKIFIRHPYPRLEWIIVKRTQGSMNFFIAIKTIIRHIQIIVAFAGIVFYLEHDLLLRLWNIKHICLPFNSFTSWNFFQGISVVKLKWKHDEKLGKTQLTTPHSQLRQTQRSRKTIHCNITKTLDSSTKRSLANCNCNLILKKTGYLLRISNSYEMNRYGV